jgi:hypothetical protein
MLLDGDEVQFRAGEFRVSVVADFALEEFVFIGDV